MLKEILKFDFANPETPFGVVFYALFFLILAAVSSHLLSVSVRKILERDKRGLINRTVASLLAQLARIGIYLLALILYAHLIPALSKIGTALLASAGVASVVVGFAAQNTLGNFVSGIALLLYRPFAIGDRIQITAVTGLETGVVETMTLGYTIIRTEDNRRVVVPNSAMASQVTVNLTPKSSKR